MPELPDILAYIAALEPRVVGKRLEAVRLGSPFLLRSISPPLSKIEGRRVVGLSRMGKRIVFALEGDLYLVLHLMVAGRLHWKKPGAKVGGRGALAAFDFRKRRRDRTEEKRAPQPHRLEPLPHHARLERRDVREDVGQLRHDGDTIGVLELGGLG